MASKLIEIKIVTPEKTVYEGTSDSISLPTENGQITVLPDHIPYITTLVPGEAIIRNGKEEVLMSISGGFIEFDKNKLTILADAAERAEEIDLKQAEEARLRAEELKKQKIHADDADYAQTMALIEKEMARVRVAKKHHSKKGIKLQ